VVKEDTEMRNTIVYRLGSTFAQQTYLTFLMLEAVSSCKVSVSLTSSCKEPYRYWSTLTFYQPNYWKRDWGMF
jgi:hypothetical protein